MTDAERPTCPFTTTKPGWMNDPFAAYATLEGLPGLVWSDAEGAWIAHSFPISRTILADRRFDVVSLTDVIGGLGTATGRDFTHIQQLTAAFLPVIQQPRYGKLRPIIAAALLAQPATDWVSAIQSICERILKLVPKDTQFDAVVGYADLVPPLVIAHIIEITDALALEFIAQSQEFGRLFDRGNSLKLFARFDAVVKKFRPLFAAEIKLVRERGSSGALGRMIAASALIGEEDDLVLADHIMLLLLTGAESTSATIGRGVAAMLDEGIDLRRVTHDAQYADQIVEETLRFDGPVQHVTRIATCEVTLAGATIKAGDWLQVLLGAANRDQDNFDGSDLFTPERTETRHLGFGAGQHYCIGASIARIEIRIALQMIASLSPIALEHGQRKWRDRQTIRRLDRLMVCFPNQETK